PVTTEDVSDARARHESLRTAVGLPADRPDADSIRVAALVAPFRGEYSLVATRGDSGDWNAVQVWKHPLPPRAGAPNEPVLTQWVVHGADARRLDKLAADPETISRSGSVVNCLDGEYGLLEVRWHSQIRQMHISCSIAGPAKTM